MSSTTTAEAPDDHFIELDGHTLTYERFRKECLEANRPAVIRHACTGEDGFSLSALQRALHPAELIKTFGHQHPVPVYAMPNTPCVESVTPTSTRTRDSLTVDPPAGTDAQAVCPNDDMMTCEDRPLGAVLQTWCEQWQSGEASTAVWYLKDWHYQREVEHAQSRAAPTCTPTATPEQIHRSVGGLYQVPRFLGPDWMDPFCRATREPERDGRSLRGFGDGKSDYRFVYMGVPGTWTRLHHDVFGTYSWSLNVCGDKLWFFPTRSGNRFLRDHLIRGFPVPPDIRVLTGFEMDAFVQHPGDLVFVPSLFFHQVHNVSGSTFALPLRRDAATEDAQGGSPLTTTTTLALTISVNHNWCNYFCVAPMMRLLTENARDLAAMVSAADLATVFGAVGHAACVRKLDEMLHTGSNWSLAAGVSFLTFCRDALAQLASSETAPSLCVDACERASALALIAQLLTELDACKASLYPDGNETPSA